MALNSANRNKVLSLIQNRREFQHGNIGGWESFHGVTAGRLPEEFRKEFYSDTHDSERNELEFYAVVSYDTPIAWYLQGKGWTIPDTRYSPTTSAHQGIARQAAHAA